MYSKHIDYIIKAWLFLCIIVVIAALPALRVVRAEAPAEEEKVNLTEALDFPLFDEATIGQAAQNEAVKAREEEALSGSLFQQYRDAANFSAVIREESLGMGLFTEPDYKLNRYPYEGPSTDEIPVWAWVVVIAGVGGASFLVIMIRHNLKRKKGDRPVYHSYH